MGKAIFYGLIGALNKAGEPLINPLLSTSEIIVWDSVH